MTGVHLMDAVQCRSDFIWWTGRPVKQSIQFTKHRDSFVSITATPTRRMGT